MTKEEFIKSQEDLFEKYDGNTDDPNIADGHIFFDELLVKALTELGYDCSIYENFPKWYY